MFTISKEFHFSASHQLTHLAETQPDHKCARNHGHNYVVRVFFKSDVLDENGFVRDYADLDWFKKLIDDKYDHRFLNDVLGSSIKTTAERLAAHFYEVIYLTHDERHWIRPYAVEVQETEKTCARYGP